MVAIAILILACVLTPERAASLGVVFESLSRVFRGLRGKSSSSPSDDSDATGKTSSSSSASSSININIVGAASSSPTTENVINVTPNASDVRPRKINSLAVRNKRSVSNAKEDVL